MRTVTETRVRKRLAVEGVAWHKQMAGPPSGLNYRMLAQVLRATADELDAIPKEAHNDDFDPASLRVEMDEDGNLTVLVDLSNVTQTEKGKD